MTEQRSISYRVWTAHYTSVLGLVAVVWAGASILSSTECSAALSVIIPQYHVVVRVPGLDNIMESSRPVHCSECHGHREVFDRLNSPSSSSTLQEGYKHSDLTFHEVFYHFREELDCVSASVRAWSSPYAPPDQDDSMFISNQYTVSHDVLNLHRDANVRCGIETQVASLSLDSDGSTIIQVIPTKGPCVFKHVAVGGSLAI
jgi:hypothetical protein